MLARIPETLAARLPFFYGYVMVPLAMMLQITTSPGQTFAFSAFTPAFREAFKMSDSHLSLAYMLGTFFAAVPLTFVGPLSDRFGLKWVSTLAVLGISATCWLASMASGWWSLLLVFFSLRFLGQGSLSLLSGNTVAMWFHSRIGRVSAMMSIGTALAFAMVPGLIRDSIESSGWRGTYQLISLVVLAITLPLIVIFFRNRPEDLGQLVDGERVELDSETSIRTIRPGNQHSSDQHSMTFQEATKTPAFWIGGVANSVWALVGTGVVFYLYILCQQRGFDDEVPSSLFKIFGLCMLAGQLGGGVLADFVRLNRMLGVGVAMLFLGTGSLLIGQSEAMLQLFSVFFGGGQGLLLAFSSVVWVRYFGRASLGAIRGSVMCATVAGSGCGPLLMGLSLDQYGNFTPALTGFLITLGVLSIAAWFAVKPKNEDTAVVQ